MQVVGGSPSICLVLSLAIVLVFALLARGNNNDDQNNTLGASVHPVAAAATVSLDSNLDELGEDQLTSFPIVIETAYSLLLRNAGELDEMFDILHDLAYAIDPRFHWSRYLDIHDKTNKPALRSLTTKLETFIDRSVLPLSEARKSNEQIFLVLSYINELSKSLY
ncbi:hypothetical protein H4R27_003981 [Coemansia aciculifera]|uniref:Uncharacterized protein n=1 Tax=Coemansia pectinata TaxID=1052879 RepID=A0A9W8GS85_9FUNG|nr:hypothetical protein GGI19_006215 [Coemansia pectinata]KAJ2881602.1 hypothetical protein H4R27_003981 [Coemansia aciculifera]